MKKLILGLSLAAFVASPAWSLPVGTQPHVAICDGTIVGQDPDSQVVLSMLRDCPGSLGVNN